MPDHANPGTTNPADQSYPAVPTPPAPRTPASAAVKSSTGEMQIPALPNALAAPSPTVGLPAEIHAGNASQIRHQLPVVASTRPPAKNFDAGTGRPGGLPINVMIR